MKRIYADNAATTRISLAASDEMRFAEAWFPGNPSSAHAEGRAAKKKLEEYRERCAKCLDCEPNEIIFTSGATEGNMTVANMTLMEDLIFHHRSSAIEHPSMLNECTEAVPVDSNGIVNPDFVDDFKIGSCRLLSVMTVNNEIGTIQPIAEIAKQCKAKRIPFHTDATAAIGHINFSFRRLGVDYMTCSAHKFHGPRGVGILVVKRNGSGLGDHLMYGGNQERGLRAGTENLPGIGGMTVALEESIRNFVENTAKTINFREKLFDGLLSIPGTVLNGDPIKRVAGNVNVSFDGIEGEALLTLLDANGIAASAGSACHTGTSEPSHVLMAIGRTREQANAGLRLTVDEENTEDDIDTIIKTVRESVEYLRKFTPNRTK